MVGEQSIEEHLLRGQKQELAVVQVHRSAVKDPSASVNIVCPDVSLPVLNMTAASQVLVIPDNSFRDKAAPNIPKLLDHKLKQAIPEYKVLFRDSQGDPGF